MVLISSTKYACETCIKGHRSSTCKHTDRPLFEIKKKGRPVTQCEHCRELRKTKQVHVKCVCEPHDDVTPKGSSCKKKSSSKVPESAAFPHGLPQALEASVAMPSPPERQTSEPNPNTSCNCKADGICNCFTPRKSAPRRRRKTVSDLTHPYDNGTRVPPHPWNTSLPLASMSSSSLTHVLARIAELRPVLPKPTASGPCHDPSSGIAHSHADRHHHDNMLFSPYGRAYEYAHGSHLEFGHGSGIRSQPANNALKEESFTESSNTLPPWNAFPDSASLPSSCGCGETCSCPGCAEHGSAALGSFQTADAFNTCTNPASCLACLDYTVMSLPNTLPPDTALSIFDSQPSQFIDDWLRQVSDVPTSISPASGFDTSLAVNLEPGFVQPPWETYQLPDNPEMEQVPDVVTDEGVVPCICLPEQCLCGGSKGGDCKHLIGSAAMAYPITGKRMSCPGINLLDVPVFSDLPASAGNDPGFLTAPVLPRSRSSSGSSYSSHNLEHLFAGRRSDDASNFRITQHYFSNDLSIASSQPDFSPTHSEHDGGAIYPVSNPDSDGSYDDIFSRYDPILEGGAGYP